MTQPRDPLADLCDALNALEDVLNLFCDYGMAEHAETVAAVRLLAGHGRVVVKREGGEWVEWRAVEMEDKP